MYILSMRDFKRDQNQIKLDPTFSFRIDLKQNELAPS